ncbi:MFS transporter [Amycolatopsis cihanbeyliensis]|uniref:MFS transporter n=1 Tax=Amycolatopsis cihanbeyliensis TaxID=1128664 RepID=A0A542DL68_AMYCI|nr:MFS transporter [Amycolatopsis cihanbeyliensis]TQJ03836.1 MFS transporter [Amycolatopsis cihanbeyliensis]
MTPSARSAPADTAERTPFGPRALLAVPDFRRLLLARFAAHWGDGVFQAGLAGAVLFNPERGADALTIAGGFAALLLPYSVVGPFAGALLDRWDRRRVLVVANLLRVIGILASAAAVGFGVEGPGLFTLALLVIGISRFVGAGMSASLPHVVPRHSLVTANSVAVTLGALVAVLGGGCAIGLRAVFGEGNTGSAGTTAIAVAGSFAAAAIAAGFTRGSLGPDRMNEPAEALLAVARGLADGGRAVARTPTVAAGFVALFAHRAAFAVSLLLTVLLMRYSFTDIGLLKAGLPGLGQVAALGGAGILLAGVLTPRLVARFGRTRVVVSALLLAAAAQAGLGLPFLLPTVLVASFLITSAGQVLKLCVDSAVQADIADETRGRVFALYDTLFNVTMVAAVTVAATLSPLDGHAPGLLLAATGCYLIGIAGYLVAVRP